MLLTQLSWLPKYFKHLLKIALGFFFFFLSGKIKNASFEVRQSTKQLSSVWLPRQRASLLNQLQPNAKQTAFQEGAKPSLTGEATSDSSELYLLWQLRLYREPHRQIALQRTDGAPHSSLTSVTHGPSGMALSQTPWAFQKAETVLHLIFASLVSKLRTSEIREIPELF